jgi:hypothetical protein
MEFKYSTRLRISTKEFFKLNDSVRRHVGLWHLIPNREPGVSVGLSQQFIQASGGGTT